ncbi:MAG: SprT-like family protein [Syntrophaceae bacterium PtaU1.Bin231]|nr:MAG: SprT-like family protein [Syntrophaceae bacterium PtaU1.Bin231]
MSVFDEALKNPFDEAIEQIDDVFSKAVAQNPVYRKKIGISEQSEIVEDTTPLPGVEPPAPQPGAGVLANLPGSIARTVEMFGRMPEVIPHVLEPVGKATGEFLRTGDLGAYKDIDVKVIGKLAEVGRGIARFVGTPLGAYGAEEAATAWETDPIGSIVAAWPVIKGNAKLAGEAKAVLKEVKLMYRPDTPLVDMPDLQRTFTLEEVPPELRGVVILSPNIRENTTLADAIKMYRSPEQGRAVAVARETMDQLGIKGKIDSAIGTWIDGGENSVALSYYNDVPFEDVKLAAARIGYAFRQKQVLATRVHPEGAGYVYDMTVGGTDLPKIVDKLNENGLYNSLVKGKDETRILAFDGDGSFFDAANRFKEEANVRRSTIWKADGEFIGGNTRTEGAAIFQSIFREADERRRMGRGGLQQPQGDYHVWPPETLKDLQGRPKGNPAGSSEKVVYDLTKDVSRYEQFLKPEDLAVFDWAATLAERYAREFDIPFKELRPKEKATGSGTYGQAHSSGNITFRFYEDKIEVGSGKREKITAARDPVSLIRTIAHELAHLKVGWTKVKPHGPEFKRVFQQIQDKMLADWGEAQQAKAQPVPELRPAIKVNGKVYSVGQTHGHIYDSIPTSELKKAEITGDIETGWIDAKGNWLDSGTALKMASQKKALEAKPSKGEIPSQASPQPSLDALAEKINRESQRGSIGIGGEKKTPHEPAWRPTDPVVAERMANAFGERKEPLLHRIANHIEDAWHIFSRPYRHLPLNGEFAWANFGLKVLEKQKAIQKDKAWRALGEIYAKLDRSQFEIMRHKIVLDDIAYEISQGRPAPTRSMRKRRCKLPSRCVTPCEEQGRRLAGRPPACRFPGQFQPFLP